MVLRAAHDEAKQIKATPRELIDGIALCDELVAWVPRRGGVRGLCWSDSDVFFYGEIANVIRDLRHRRDIPQAVDRVEILGVKFGPEHLKLRTEQAYGLVEGGKENWSSGVKHSCER